MNSHIFKNYDIRGVFDQELNEQVVKAIGFCFAQIVQASSTQTTNYISVGYDCRTHSPTVFNWLISGINQAGVKVLNIGVVPTPCSYFSLYQDFVIDGEVVQPQAASMITASHNPKDYNGFKLTLDKKPFFAEDIQNLKLKVQDLNIAIKDDLACFEVPLKAMYIDFISQHFYALRGMKGRFIFDCGNGAANFVLEDILKNLNINYELLFKTPDGTFPNHHPDPSVEANLQELKNELHSYDLGFAFDGDADRMALLDQNYNYSGDILALCFASDLQQKGKKAVIIGEVKCSKLMYDLINANYGQAIMHKTGHSNLKLKIQETNADLAAELSGHLFFNDRYFGYDDAIYAALRCLELFANGFDFKGFYASLPKIYNTPEIKIKVNESHKKPIMSTLKQQIQLNTELPKIDEIINIDGLRIHFDQAWALVRPSNTTAHLVLRFEAQDQQTLAQIQTIITNIVESIIKA